MRSRDGVLLIFAMGWGTLAGTLRAQLELEPATSPTQCPAPQGHSYVIGASR